jgi:hypothetical protein
MVLPPIEMRKVNYRGHDLVVSKNEESRATANDSQNYRVLFEMEKDVGTRVARFICNKNYYYYTRTVMSPPKKLQSSRKLLTTVSPYDWQPAPKNGAQVFTPMHLQERAQQSDTIKKGSLRQHNASYRYNLCPKPTLKLPLGVSWVRPKLGIQCSQIPLFYPLADWNLSMKQR